MTKHWVGAARRAVAGDFARAAEALGCSVEVVRAVWEVEASGRPFRADGSLERRFEPHKLAKPDGNYKTSMALSHAARETKFARAFAANANDAMRATSWGGPQIMGFNHSAAGFGSVAAMVEAFADDEAAQLRGFVALIRSWGLDSAVRAHDWRTFTARYNGNANVAAYSAKLESAYQRLAGRASAVVLRSGDKGEAVRRLQQALGVSVDGSFGPETDQAVRAFQTYAGLPVDGIVGARTWTALEARTSAAPVRQPAEKDRIARATEVVTLGGTAAGAIATVGAALPESSVNLLIIGAGILGLIALAVFAFRKARGVA
ncbi:MAG TPA: N-acetylmuramidase domain-containing protein [Novosphingobium sp.]|jgi:hypothetical protein|nr:N-acetylmuramidase domain-containing protein [Novosphingobium sp.]